jgi:MFS transporter, DHA2 family, multidrug resistance protein
MNGDAVAMSPTSPEAAGKPAGRREWVGLAVIALPCMLYSMDLTVLNLALPSLSADLRPSSTQLLWIVDIYGFMVAGLLIPMGTLGDRIGRRRLLMIGAAAFGVASVLAAFASSAEMLIAMRALLGIAGATLAPSTLSLIRNMFHEPAQRTVAIGIWVASYSVGAAIGPMVGGLLLEYFWWGSVFLLGVPVMLLLLMIGPILLPEFRDPEAGRLDLPSIALSMLAVLAVIYGLKRIAEDGWSWTAAFAVTAGLLAGIAFLRRQPRLEVPLIDLRLFRLPAFSAALAAYALGCFVLFGVYLFIGQYLQLVLELTPLQAGFWTLPWALSFVVGSMLTPLLVRRVPATVVVTGGLVLAAIGFALLVQPFARLGLAVVLVATVTMSLGLAPVFTLATDLVVSAAPPERAGVAAAISETCSEFGGAMGIAILGSIGTAVYRAGIGGDAAAFIPPDAMEASRASLGAAVAIAGQASGETATTIVSLAQQAFLHGLQVMSLIAACTMMATALAFGAVMRPGATLPRIR